MAVAARAAAMAAAAAVQGLRSVVTLTETIDKYRITFRVTAQDPNPGTVETIFERSELVGNDGSIAEAREEARSVVVEACQTRWS